MKQYNPEVSEFSEVSHSHPGGSSFILMGPLLRIRKLREIAALSQSSPSVWLVSVLRMHACKNG